MLITLDGLMCGGQFDGQAPVIDGVQWVASKLTGWWGAAPAPRVRHVVRSSAHGARRSAAYLGSRSYELEVTATAVDLSSVRMRRAEQALAALCADPGELYRLTVEDDAGTLCAYVERDGEILPTAREGLDYSTIFSIPLVAPDPFRYAPAWVTVGPADAAGPGSGGIVTTSPGISTAAPGILTGTAPALATVEVRAEGTRASQLVLQVRGPTTDVFVSELTTASVIFIRGEIGDGESLFINTSGQVAHDVPGCDVPIPAYRAVLGGADARGALRITGGWPSVPPGAARTYRLSGSTGTGAALTAHTRGTWI